MSRVFCFSQFVIASVAWQSQGEKLERVRLPRRFTPRNDKMVKGY